MTIGFNYNFAGWCMIVSSWVMIAILLLLAIVLPIYCSRKKK